jgi:hypothetical protein
VAPSKACYQFFGGIDQNRCVLTSALRLCLWFSQRFYSVFSCLRYVFVHIELVCGI